MAYTTIDKSSLQFNTKLYTGNGGTQTISGIGFNPSFAWFKTRTSTSHMLQDQVRGTGNFLESNNNTAAQSSSDGITSFNSDGYAIGDNGRLNSNGTSMVSWNWKANGQGSSNTDGSINTIYTSANPTAGFSIVRYTGNGSAGATIGHGLGVAPKFIIVKSDSDNYNWTVYYGDPTDYLVLNGTDTTTDSVEVWNDTAPSSTLITLGNRNSTNQNTATFVAYCFSEIQGFSKTGTYTGNGNDGSGSAPMIYTGFKPAFIILKRTDSADNWFIFDNKRKGYNTENDYLYANLTNGEGSTDILDIVSSGFKLRTTDSGMNAGGGSYIYIAFADNPFVTSTGVPTPAR